MLTTKNFLKPIVDKKKQQEEEQESNQIQLPLPESHPVYIIPHPMDEDNTTEEVEQDLKNYYEVTYGL